MTKLEAEIVSIVRGQGFAVHVAHGEHHLPWGEAFLNLTSLALRLAEYLDMECADSYAEGFGQGYDEGARHDPL